MRKGIDGLTTLIQDERIEIDNNPDENANRTNVPGRRKLLFRVSEAGTKANAFCLSIAESVKRKGTDFYEYIKKLFPDPPNLGIHQKLVKNDSGRW